MNTQKLINIFDKAKTEINTKDEYLFTQKVIELTLAEVMDAVDTTSLKERTYTTYDKGMMDFCRSAFRQEIEKRFK